jgi:NAD(P)-dependent dehydrogenase (short-subunit alcohol dehydrogenase family)
MSGKGLFDLTGRTVLVTGANAGIGFGFATALADAGANLVIWGRRTDRNEEAAEKLRAKGGRVLAQQVDIAREEEIVTAFAAAVAQIGAIHAVFANAGITVGYEMTEDITAETLMRAISVNQIGTTLTVREAARHMIARGEGGSIVITGSATGDVGFKMGILAYSMTKGALHAGTRVMAAELGRHNIRVNCIVPGPIETELSYPKEVLDAVIAGLALERPGTQADVGGLAVYLASDASAFQTGSCIALDGGQTIIK